MHTHTDTTAADLAALEARLREVIASVTGDPAPSVTREDVERDMDHLAAVAEASPSVLTLAQRYAILAPAAAGIGLHSDSGRVRAAAALIDDAFAVRSLAAPRLAGFLPAVDLNDTSTVATVAAAAPTLAWLTDPTSTTPAAGPATTDQTVTVGTAPATETPVATDIDTDADEPDDAEPFWPFGDSPDSIEPPTSPATASATASAADDPFVDWVASELAAGRTVTGRAAATHLGVSASTGRRRLDAVKASRSDLFTRPASPAVPAAPATALPSTPPTTPPPVLPTAAPVPDAPVPDAVAELDEDLEVTQIRPRRGVAPSVVIVTSTAGPVTLTGTGVLGRRPTGAGVHIRFPDPGRSVSKTHLGFVVDDDGLAITDLRSGNGTRIHRAGHLTDCTPGQSYRIAAGDVVEIGDQHFTHSA